MNDDPSSKSTESKEEKPFRGVVFDDVDSPVEVMCRYLNRTQPARLLIYSFIALAITALLTVVGSKMTLDGFTPYVMGLFIFFFGTIGAIIPMWAVGRLIADAIKEGARNE